APGRNPEYSGRPPGPGRSGSAGRSILHAGLEPAHLRSAEGSDCRSAGKGAEPSFVARAAGKRIEPADHAARPGGPEESRLDTRGGKARADMPASRRSLLWHVASSPWSDVGRICYSSTALPPARRISFQTEDLAPTRVGRQTNSPNPNQGG